MLVLNKSRRGGLPRQAGREDRHQLTGRGRQYLARVLHGDRDRLRSWCDGSHQTCITRTQASALAGFCLSAFGDGLFVCI